MACFAGSAFAGHVLSLHVIINALLVFLPTPNPYRSLRLQVNFVFRNPAGHNKTHGLFRRHRLRRPRLLPPRVYKPPELRRTRGRDRAMLHVIQLLHDATALRALLPGAASPMLGRAVRREGAQPGGMEAAPEAGKRSEVLYVCRSDYIFPFDVDL